MDAYRQAENLVARYAELIDEGDFEALGALFVRGSIQFVPGGLSLHGADEISRFYRDSIHINAASGSPGTVHQVSNLLLQPLDKHLQGRSRYRVTLAREGEAPKLIATGRYFDQFVIENERVLFQQRRVVSEYVGDLSSHLTTPLPPIASNYPQHHI